MRKGLVVSERSARIARKIKTTREAPMQRYVYVGAAGAPATGSGPQMQGTYRLNVDSGQWQRLTGGLPGDIEVRSIVTQPDAPNIVYAGAQNGLYRSTDAGDTCQALPLPGKERVVWSIPIQPKDK